MRIDIPGSMAIERLVPEGHYVHHTSSLRLRGQLVRRSFRSMLKVGLASEARSTKAYAKAEGRLRQRDAEDQEI
jgi:hypothetical protein